MQININMKLRFKIQKSLQQQLEGVKNQERQSMIAWIQIILILVFIAILAVINVYLLKLYEHKDDKGWKNYSYCKILIILGLTLCQAQAFLVSLDVANSVDPLGTNGINMLLLWNIVYAVVLLLISVLLPYALFFYQADQQKSICHRLVIAFCYTLGAIIISALILFVTWAVFNYVRLPYTELSLSYNQFFDRNKGVAVVNQPGSSEKVIEIQASFAVYIMAILSFFGWIFLVLFGGVGLFGLPIDLINQFRHRPRPRRPRQMQNARQAMTIALRDLVTQSEQIKSLNTISQRNTQAGFMSKMRINRQLQNKINRFKIKYYSIQEQFRIFNLELKFADTNPLVPFCKLLLGIIFLITAILWMIQIIFGSIAKAYYNSSLPLIPFMNEMLTGLEDKNAGFLSMFIFAYLCLYILWSVQKGNIKFGIRLPFCCRFHPMIAGETWMNSFIFNVILLLIASVGVIQLCIACFPIYTRNTDIFVIFGNTVRYMTFYKYFYDHNVFTIAFVVWSLIALIYMLVTINKKPSYLKEIQNIREKKLQAKREADQLQSN